MHRLRPARPEDIAQASDIRLSVTENRLSDPTKITERDYQAFFFERGQAWVWEENERILGFACLDHQANNVWALFVHPNAEGKGIGSALLHRLLETHFSRTSSPIWLSTDPQTRAARFYRYQGWQDQGLLPNGEIKFTMDPEHWQQNPHG